MPNLSDVGAEFRNVVKDYHRFHRNRVGLKHALLHLPSFIRELRTSAQFRALDGVSFQVRKGETFGICGKNGAGKSTILGLMAGILRPTSGEVVVEGRISPLLQVGAGFHGDLTGRENVRLNATILGMSRREIAERMDAIVEFAGLREFIDEPMRTYSTGMFLRLGFSVAAHTDPDVLLVDEAFAVGDEQFRQQCLERMERFRREGVTTIVVTHEISLVKRICDRMLLIDRGRVVRIGPPGEVEPE